jgi:hypothetical protein
MFKNENGEKYLLKWTGRYKWISHNIIQVVKNINGVQSQNLERNILTISIVIVGFQIQSYYLSEFQMTDMDKTCRRVRPSPMLRERYIQHFFRNRDGKRLPIKYRQYYLLT